MTARWVLTGSRPGQSELVDKCLIIMVWEAGSEGFQKPKNSSWKGEESDMVGLA